MDILTCNKQGRQSVIVDRIGYDKEGHTAIRSSVIGRRISLRGTALDSLTINSYIS